MKYVLSLTLIICALILLSCGNGKNEPKREELESQKTSDTMSTPFVEDTASINDEDHGDPGMEGLIIDPEMLEADVKAFLYWLTPDGLQNAVEKNVDVLHIKSGAGVSPTYRFLPSSSELKAIDEFKIYLTDSAALSTATFYRMVHDPCEIMAGLPEGIYLRDYDFKDLSCPNDGMNEKLQAFISQKQKENGVEFFINFKNASDERAFLHLFTLRGDGKLFLVIVDQRDCEA